MNLSKKWLPTTLAAMLAVSLLSACSEEGKGKQAADKAADLAIKEAYSTLWSGSYNYQGTALISIKEDETALIGTKGGLTEEEAQQELELVQELQSPDSRQALEILRSGNVTFQGAFDGANMKSDLTLGLNYEMNGIKASLSVPLLMEWKNSISFYIDPKAAKAFGVLPPQLDGKLVKIALDELPDLTPAQKEKLKSGENFYKKFEKISQDYINNLDAKNFKDGELSEAAKAAGATRVVQLTLTPEENAKASEQMMDQILTTFASEFELSADDIAEMKKEYQESNKRTQLFLGDAVYNYGLDKEGQIVYMDYVQSGKGAKHVGDMKFVMSMKDFGKPTFTVDPSKQPVISLEDTMKIFFGG